MDVQELFNFVTDSTVTAENMNAYLDAASERSSINATREINPAKEIEKEVFKQAYIPQNLMQVVDIKRDISLAKAGKNDLIFKTLVGLKVNLKTADVPEILANRNNKSSSDENSSEDFDVSDDDDDEEENTDSSKFVNASRPKNETADERKARKKEVKQAQADKRKNKLKKHVKKRNVKLGKQK